MKTEFNNDRSMTRLELGDVFKLEGTNYIVDRVSDSGARAIPLNVVAREVKIGDDKSFETTKYGRVIHVSGTTDSSMILERAGESGLKDFLGAKRSPSATGTNNEGDTKTETKDNDMKNKTDNTLPKGGLVADAIRAKQGAKKTKAAKPAKESDGSKGALGHLFGFSITSSIRRLGAEGLTVGQIIKALASQKIDPAEATVKIQRGRGIRKDGDLAEFTGAQLKELKAAAGPAEKEEAPKVKGKKAAKAKSAPKPGTKAAAKAKKQPAEPEPEPTPEPAGESTDTAASEPAAE